MGSEVEKGCIKVAASTSAATTSAANQIARLDYYFIDPILSLSRSCTYSPTILCRMLIYYI